MSKIFVLSSPSGSGKTTLRDIAIENVDNLYKIVTMTSRLPRANECDKIDYYFMHKNEMIDLEKRDEMVEMVETYGNLYGTPKSEIQKYIDENKDIIIILDAYGKVKFDKIYETIGIFISPPCETTLRDRLSSRWDSEPTNEELKELEKRIDRSNKEVKYAHEHGNYKYSIDGTMSIKDCSDELISIIRTECNVG